MSLCENTIAYQVTIHRWGIKRQIPKAVLKELFPNDTERTLVERNMLSANKRIIESKEYDAIVSRDGFAMRWLAEHSVPSMLKRGVYCVPTVLVEEVDGYMEEYKYERCNLLVPAFIERYEEQAYAARDLLGTELFSAMEYPTVEKMQTLFSVDTSYIAFDVPSSLKYVSEEFFRREQERVQQAWKDAEQVVNQLLLEECLELVGGLQTALTGLNDGTLKKFREANIANLQEWSALFLQARNVTNNKQLGDVVSRIQSILQGVSREDLKVNAGNIRQYVHSAISQAQVELKGMLEEMPMRAISFD